MTLQEIKEAVMTSKKVYWMSTVYHVIHSKGYYYIECIHNGSTIALAWSDSVTLNGKEADFFIGE